MFGHHDLKGEPLGLRDLVSAELLRLKRPLRFTLVAVLSWYVFGHNVVHAAGSGGRVWVSHWRDAQLQDYLDRVVQYSPDLKAATARIREADAVARQARAPLFPELSAQAEGTIGPAGALGFQFGGGAAGAGPDYYLRGSATLNARYRLDAWGGDYLALASARWSERAARGDRAALAIALAATVSEAYFDAVYAREQYDVLRKQVKVGEQLLELTLMLYERGGSTALAVLQQKQQLSGTRAALPQARLLYRQSLQQLRSVLGFGATAEPLRTADVLRNLPPQPRLGSTKTLVKNRPDLKAARARVRAADKRAAGLWWGHLPTVELSAQAGYQALVLQETRELEFWSVSGLVSLPIFTGFRITSQVDEAKASARVAVGELEQAVFDALAEVRQALIFEKEHTRSLDAYAEQLKAANAALKESQRSYIEGGGDYLDVLSALNAQQTAELNTLQAKRSVFSARVALLQALGLPVREPT